MSLEVFLFFIPLIINSQDCKQLGCGTYNPNLPCQCDTKCQDTNDCCSDFMEICASCQHIGCDVHRHESPCQCNPNCRLMNNCCDDYEDTCNSHTFTECPIPSNPGDDRREDKTKLKIINYNLDWLFLDGRHSMGTAICPGDNCRWKNTSIAAEHLKILADYLNEFDADILLFQEVCDCWTLKRLISLFPRAKQHLYKPYLLAGTDTRTGQNVAMISKIDPIKPLNRSNEFWKYPIPNSNCEWNHNPGDYIDVDKHFQASFRIDGIDKPVSIFNIHLVPDPKIPEQCSKREAQAMILANMIKNSINLGEYIIITGDYNDYSDQIPDCNNNYPKSEVTQIIRDSGDLLNVAFRISEQDDRYTYWYNIYDDCLDTPGKDRSMVDQFLISQQLYDYLNTINIDHSYKNGCDCLYSNHWPIIVDFDINIKSKNVSKNT